MQWNFEKFRLRFPEKKRIRFFSLFVSLSILFWIITKLSNSYSSSVTFEVDFVNVPDLIVLDQNQEITIKADITASGFQLLMYHYFIKQLDVSLVDADFTENFATVEMMDQKFYLQQQLFQSAILNSISPKQMIFPYGKLKRKKIPVFPPDALRYKPGYDRSGDWKINPDSVWVYGPDQKIDTLIGAFIEPFSKEDIDIDINEKVRLLSLDQIKFETSDVLIQAKVNRFTEKSLDAFIHIKNLPDSLAIKLFPQTLQLTFSVLVDKAEGIKPSDFNFYCDFRKIQLTEQNTLDIFLENEPEGVRNIRWQPKKVDYLIRK